jgi:hypothetical protein
MITNEARRTLFQLSRARLERDLRLGEVSLRRRTLP